MIFFYLFVRLRYLVPFFNFGFLRVTSGQLRITVSVFGLHRVYFKVGIEQNLGDRQNIFFLNLK